MRKYTGEITFLNDSFGFVLDHEENSRFFHASHVKGATFEDLQIGDRVEFTPFVGPRGRRAEDVRLIVKRSVAA